MPGLTIDDRISWSPNQLATEVEGEVVLMSIDHGSYYGLNETGSDIWRKLREPIDIRTVCSQLGEEYDGDREVMTRQVLDLLDKMLEDGLIQRAA